MRRLAKKGLGEDFCPSSGGRCGMGIMSTCRLRFDSSPRRTPSEGWGCVYVLSRRSVGETGVAAADLRSIRKRTAKDIRDSLRAFIWEGQRRRQRCKRGDSQRLGNDTTQPVKLTTTRNKHWRRGQEHNPHNSQPHENNIGGEQVNERHDTRTQVHIAYNSPQGTGVWEGDLALRKGYHSTAVFTTGRGLGFIIARTG